MLGEAIEEGAALAAESVTADRVVVVAQEAREKNGERGR
jgi:hypothetical protein